MLGAGSGVRVGRWPCSKQAILRRNFINVDNTLYCITCGREVQFNLSSKKYNHIGMWSTYNEC